MILSKREKMIAIIASIAIAIPLLDRFAVRPALNHRTELKASVVELDMSLRQAENTLARRAALQRRWNAMLDAGIVMGEGDAERLMLNALQEWSQRSGFALTTRRPDQIVREGDLRETVIIATGTGNMRSLARFIWMMETSDIPARIKDLQLTARSDGVDDLSVQMRVSGIFLRDDAPMVRMFPAAHGEGGATQ